MNPYTRFKIILFTPTPGVRDYYLHTIKLSYNPTLPECVIVGAFSHMLIGFRKIGDEKWNIFPHSHHVDDVIYYNGMTYAAECSIVSNFLTIWRYLGNKQKEWLIPHVPHLPIKNMSFLFQSYHIICPVWWDIAMVNPHVAMSLSFMLWGWMRIAKNGSVWI